MKRIKDIFSPDKNIAITKKTIDKFVKLILFIVLRLRKIKLTAMIPKFLNNYLISTHHQRDLDI